MKLIASLLIMLALAVSGHAQSALSAVTISKSLTLTSPSAYISMSGVSATASLRNVSSTAMQTSTITATTVNGATVVSSSQIFASVDFDGNAGCSMRRTYNVASCARTATGQYGVSFTTPASSANYSFVCTSLPVGASNSGWAGQFSGVSKTTAGFRFSSLLLSGGTITEADSGDVSCIVVGG